MEIGKITLDGINVVAIEDLKIEGKINCHSSLKLKCLIEEKDMKNYILLPDRKEIITVNMEDNVIFSGVVVEAVCKNKKGNTYLYLTLLDNGYLLDIQRNSKSYQNINMTYEEIANDKVVTIFSGENKAIGNVVFQYQETDWEFLMKLSSRLETGIFADIRQSKSVIYWGIPEDRTPKNIKISDYSTEKDMDYIKECKENTKKQPIETACITYEFESDELLEVGDCVIIGGRKVYVVEMTCEMEQVAFRGKYKAKHKEGICFMPRYNYDLPGTSLEGTVIDIKEDKIKVHLLIDKNQDKEGAYWFPFSAMEASSDGSGWYYMPEVGDCVKVCIPAWEEGDTFAVSAVSTYTNDSQGEDKMADTNTMYMSNPSGKQMQMKPSQIKMDGGAGKAIFEMNAEGDMIVFANESVNMHATEIIEIEAQDMVEIKASKVLNIKTAMTGELLMNEEGDLQHLGGHVNINKEE